MYELQTDISRKAISLNDLSKKPSFGFGMDYIMVNDRDDVSLLNNGRDIIQLRASVKIPIYKDKYRAKEMEENLKIAILENKKSDTFSEFRASIEKAYTEYNIAKLKTELYSKQIEITKATINILHSEYSSSGNKFDELLRLEKELIDYELKILKEIVQSHIAKTKIRYSV